MEMERGETGQVTPSQEGREERVKRKHWKRTGSMVRDSENRIKRRGRWKRSDKKKKDLNRKK